MALPAYVTPAKELPAPGAAHALTSSLALVVTAAVALLIRQ